jgi:hypothetical protein
MLSKKADAFTLPFSIPKNQAGVGIGPAVGKLDRHQKVMDIFSTCQCEELPMLRGRKRAPRGSRIAGQSEAPSGTTAMALTDGWS